MTDFFLTVFVHYFPLSSALPYLLLLFFVGFCFVALTFSFLFSDLFSAELQRAFHCFLIQLLPTEALSLAVKISPPQIYTPPSNFIPHPLYNGCLLSPFFITFFLVVEKLGKVS